jgi:eukaryotic-like serine/threonine-protein kinase
MGEVYRALDAKLGREVAIKVLSGEFSSQRARLDRFEKEARAASSLNHPNIVTVYEIDRTESGAWIVMELIEGKTLRGVLVPGPLSIRRLLSLAAQMGDGLAKAHDAGLVHRDLKPENLMVTKDGFVKILDFGLAKLLPSGFEAAGGTELPTVTRGTEPGTVLETVEYMSPEQASGRPLDFRSDQFSLGAILYEMASGKRVFQRPTAVQTLSAILSDEPEPLSSVAPKVPANLIWIIERCLAKDPEERYASTKDLARDLAVLRDHVSEASGVVGPVSLEVSRPRRSILVLVAAAALVAMGAVAARLLRSPSQPAVPRLHQLTFRRGVTGQMRFAPDGQTIVYSAAWDGKPHELFSTRVDSPESRSLGLPSADILAISSKGEMAIRLLPSGTLARVPLAGGSPRELLEGVESADWAPDGSGLAIIHRVGETLRLEYPIGKVLVESTGRLTSLRFSPSGNRIAFMEGAPGAGEASACVLELTGKKRILSAVPGGIDLVWAAAGDEVWVNAAQEQLQSASELRAIRLDGRSRPLARFPDVVRLCDVFSDGRALIEHVRFRGEIWGFPPKEPGQVPLSWFDGSEAFGLSADGRMLLINEWARKAVYLRGTDGRPAIRLGEGSARALSRDGKWALVSRLSPARLVLLPTGPGQPREYPLGRIQMWRAGNASFFPDAGRAVILGHEPGEKNRSYVLDFASGAIVPITPPGTEGLLISPDGGSLLARGVDGKFALYPVEPSAGPARPVAGLDPEDSPIAWTGTGQSVFVVREDGLTARVFAVDTATGSRTAVREFRPADPAGVLNPGTVLATPDGSFWVHYYWRNLTDLYLVDGLK